jgi:hypothetical protein
VGEHRRGPREPGHDDQRRPAAVVPVAQPRRHGAFDIAVGLPPGADPAPWAKAGATWWMPEFSPEALSLDEVRGVLRDGPAPETP